MIKRKPTHSIALLPAMLLIVTSFCACGTMSYESNFYQDGLYNSRANQGKKWSEVEEKWTAPLPSGVDTAKMRKLCCEASSFLPKNSYRTSVVVRIDPFFLDSWYYRPWYWDSWYWPWRPWGPGWYRPYGPWGPYRPWPVYVSYGRSASGNGAAGRMGGGGGASSSYGRYGGSASGSYRNGYNSYYGGRSGYNNYGGNGYRGGSGYSGGSYSGGSSYGGGGGYSGGSSSGGSAGRR